MSSLLLTSALLVTVLIINVLVQAAPPVTGKWEASTPQGMLMEDKIRLGSTPPSCHNRCNECKPCMAVQVPTMPGRDQTGLGFGRKMVFPKNGGGGTVSFRGYPNYKPLGWKCRCHDHLFNP